MTTKNNYLVTKDKRQSFVNDGNFLFDNGNQYSNLNLNQNYKCSDSTPVQSESKSFNNKYSDSTVSENREEIEKLHAWNKSTKNFIFSSPNNEIKEFERLGKKGQSLDIKNNSTLSLHIAAFENSIPALSDELKNERLDKEKSQLIKNSKQSFNVSTFVIQNPFEFPRQQRYKVIEPEVSHFRASQRLINPNQTSKYGQQIISQQPTESADGIRVAMEPYPMNQVVRDSYERQPPHSRQLKSNRNVTFDDAVPSPHKPRSKSVGLVLNPKAARARQAFLKHNNDREVGGRIKLSEGHIIEANSANALQFFSTHHDYRRGKIRENYVPKFPVGDALYENATLKPGEQFSKAMYDDVVGLYSVDADGNPVTIEMIDCYEDAGVSEQLLINLTKMDITQPLPIQCFLIPFLLNCTDQDVVASAPTGSGKTIAVMLPLIELCIRAKKHEQYGDRPLNAPFAIVIGATRDLVHQLCLDSLRIANDTGVRIRSAYGEYQRDANAQHIKEGCDILIATTGRFVDLVDKEDVLVQYARYFAVDEADKLVTDELIQDLQLVLDNRIRPDIIHALFSATFNENVLSILPKLLRKNFVRVELQTQCISPTVKQRFYCTEIFQRKEFILQLLKKKASLIPKEELPYDVTNFIHPDQYRVPKTIIYCEGRRTIDYLSIFLSMNGIRSISMHGGRSQSQRNDAWSGFINGKYQVLCASNVAARGINFPDVVLIINYDAPIDMDCYIHRIGRAGRLGFKAKAITFLDPTDTQQMMLASHIVPALRKLNQPVPLFLQTMANFINFGTQDDINVYL